MCVCLCVCVLPERGVLNLGEGKRRVKDQAYVSLFSPETNTVFHVSPSSFYFQTCFIVFTLFPHTVTKNNLVFCYFIINIDAPPGSGPKVQALFPWRPRNCCRTGGPVVVEDADGFNEL